MRTDMVMCQTAEVVLCPTRCPICRVLGAVLSGGSLLLLVLLMLGYGVTVAQTASIVSIQPCRPGTKVIEPAQVNTLLPEELYLDNLSVDPAAKETLGISSLHTMIMFNKPHASVAGALVASQQSGVVIEPDYLQYAHPGDRLTFTHWLTNLGSYTETFFIQVLPSLSWPVSPTETHLSNVGVGEMRPITVMITVPHESLVYIENEVIVSATSTTSSAADSAVDVVMVSPWRVFLPTVTKPYVSPDPFCNGDFSSEFAPCWTFTGNLSVERLCSSGSCFARFGSAQDDSKCLGQLTPGNAELLQTYTPATTGDATLTFQYEIRTQDVLSSIYDTLQVYIDGTLEFMVTQTNADYGCDHPSMVVSDTVAIPLSLVRGEPTTMRFVLVHSDTWFNTYADIRNVLIRID